MSAKCRLTVNLSENEYVTLAELAERSRVSMAWLGRQAIVALLEREKSEQQQQLPLPLTGFKRRVD